MKDYQFFEFGDFLEDVSFRRWVYHPRPQDTDFWNQWLAEHPDKEATVRQAREQLLAIKGNLPTLSDDYIDQKVAQIVQQAQSLDTPAEKPLLIVQRFSPNWYYAAASVALLLGLFWLYQHGQTSRPAETVYSQLIESAVQPLQEIENMGSIPKKVTLADGSVVFLYKNSRLSYPNEFTGTSREVYLTGQAFFQVHKDPSKPFLVYANELVTKVLGTSFFVKAYANDQHVQVTVRTGKVSVFAQSDKQAATQKTSRELGGMILTPNQQATLVRSDKRLMRTLIANPIRIDTDTQTLTKSFVFKQTPIAEVFAALERAYGVDIVFDEALMAHCTLTAQLDDESLFKKLDWICAGTESSYEVVDGQIIISSRGCE